MQASNTITDQMTYWIATIDRKINRQLNKVLANDRLRQLEASWQGLYYLVKQAKKTKQIKIKMLPLSKKQLGNDLLHAIDFDQSQMFEKIYHQEFGAPGGEPFSVLLGDYEFSAKPADIDLLDCVSQVAAAAFAPFISGAAASLFGINHFTELNRAPNIDNVFKQPDYLTWFNLRQKEDSRFLGLCLPRFKIRKPHKQFHYKNCGFNFNAKGKANANLWANASYAFVSVLIKAFIDYHWLGHIRGTAGGAPSPAIKSDKLVDVFINQEQEYMLSSHGFITLTQASRYDQAIFYNNSSIQTAKQYDKPIATINAQTSTQLQYILCASRFAHYLKIIGREKIGSGLSATECEQQLNQWLLDYVVGNNNLTLEQRAKYPLQAAKVKVQKHPSKSGAFFCVAHLKPFFQVEQIQTTVVLITQIATQSSL